MVRVPSFTLEKHPCSCQILFEGRTTKKMGVGVGPNTLTKVKDKLPSRRSNYTPTLATTPSEPV